MLFTKGIEEELFVGTRDGTGLSLSKRVQQHVQGFVRELDGRFTEYATQPCRHYRCILRQMLDARQRLRSFLDLEGSHSVIPGGTLPLDPQGAVCPADIEDPYYRYLLSRFGARAVMAGSHLNVGIDDVDLLMRACRVTRLESALYIALTAASPFLEGKATGHQSTRWAFFPQEPFPVPLFESHGHYVAWVEEQIRRRHMINVRHLWASARPNGERRPYDINRLEVRVCDSNPDPRVTLAALALLECRVAFLASRPHVDIQQVPPRHLDPEEVRQHELAACRDGLDAEVFRWDTGATCSVRDWIQDLYAQAIDGGVSQEQRLALEPIQRVLRHGNAADLLLDELDQEGCVENVISASIVRMENIERVIRKTMSWNDDAVSCRHLEERYLASA